MEDDAYDMISILADSEELVTIKEKYKRKDGDYDMCKALEEMKEDARKEGMETGIEALILDNMEENKSEECILHKLKKRFCLTEEQAQKYLQKYWEE